MVRMGAVWDQTVEVLRGRAGILAPIATTAIFLPAVVNNALAAFSTPGTRTVAILALVVALGVLVANVWGQLAMLAVATHPATTRADAGQQATQRLLPTLGVLMVLGVVFALAMVPALLMLSRLGMTISAASQAGTFVVPAGQGQAAGFVGLYSLVLLAVVLFLGARLILLNPVLLNERRGVAALRRAFVLTRGMTVRIIGLMLLFGVMVLVPTLAVQSVIGLIVRLAVGEAGIAAAAFVAAVAGSAVTTAFTVVAAVFTARLYVAVIDARGEGVGRG